MSTTWRFFGNENAELARRLEGGTADIPASISIEEIIWRQQPIPGGWVCPECVHHAGGIGCDRGVFVSFVGANMKGCRGFEPGKPCRHCGMMT